MRALAAARVVALASVIAAPPAWAEKPAPPKPPPAKPAAPTPAPDARPYDGDLLRLAEILGALTYLRGLCGDKDADAWHQRMQALLDAEGTTPVRKDRLAGAYNSGIQGYELSYHACTANAHLVIDRFLAEASRIAKAVENRFGAT
jgi:uncharacterized protein (TIGR02301 family)